MGRFRQEIRRIDIVGAVRLSEEKIQPVPKMNQKPFGD